MSRPEVHKHRKGRPEKNLNGWRTAQLSPLAALLMERQFVAYAPMLNQAQKRAKKKRNKQASKSRARNHR